MFAIKILIHSCIIILYIVEKIYFCHYCLEAFSTEEILKRRIKVCYKINAKQGIIMPEKDKYFKFKSFKRKINSSFMIYADFENTLVSPQAKSKIVLYE